MVAHYTTVLSLSTLVVTTVMWCTAQMKLELTIYININVQMLHYKYGPNLIGLGHISYNSNNGGQ